MSSGDATAIDAIAAAAQGRHHRHRGPARPHRRAPAAPRSRLADRRPRSPAVAGPPEGHRAPPGRSAQQEGARRLPHRRRRRADPPGRHARPARAPRRALLVEHHRHRRSCSSTARRTACPKVVLLSSANVYGPRPDNPQFLTEDAPLLAAQRFPQMRDLVEIDHLVSTFLWRAREIETVILRPVHIVGPVHNAPSNYLRLERPPIAARLRSDGAAHPRATTSPRRSRCALAPGRRGIYNVVGPGEVPLSAVLRELGREPRADPAPDRQAAPVARVPARASRASRSPSSTSSATSAWSTAAAPRPSSGSGPASACARPSTRSTIPV